MYIALCNGYSNYQAALEETNLETLASRRRKLCKNFAVKASKHPKHNHWFVKNKPPGPNTRSDKSEYKPPLGRLERFKKSPIPYLTNLLNTS
jgi:hypothetical protein